MLRIGITGGIGSGKSTVSRIFRLLGIPVYDSDSRAKYLMEHDAELVAELTKQFGNDIYSPHGQLLRQRLAELVFSEESRLALLNSIVHPAVGRDFIRWSARMENSGAAYVMLESAILLESGFDRFVDAAINVSAPEAIRIERTMARDGLAYEKVLARVRNQMPDSEREARTRYIINNDGTALLAPQIVELDKIFRK